MLQRNQAHRGTTHTHTHTQKKKKKKEEEEGNWASKKRHLQRPALTSQHGGGN